MSDMCSPMFFRFYKGNVSYSTFSFIAAQFTTFQCLTGIKGAVYEKRSTWREFALRKRTIRISIAILLRHIVVVSVSQIYHSVAV